MPKELVDNPGQMILHQPPDNNIITTPLPSLAEGTKNIIQTCIIAKLITDTLLYLWQFLQNMQLTYKHYWKLLQDFTMTKKIHLHYWQLLIVIIEKVRTHY